jgi:hypothetical protein
VYHEQEKKLVAQVRYYPAKSVARKVERADAPGAEVWYYEENGTTFAYGWRSAKTINHTFHHRFRSTEKRDEFVKGFFDGIKLTLEYRQERKARDRAENAQANPFKLGDVLVNSWGYEQTNVDFYQVVEVTGKSVVLREIGSETVNDNAQGLSIPTQSMADYRVARRDKFTSDETVTKRVRWSSGEPCVSMDHGHCGLWDGAPEYCSYYG